MSVIDFISKEELLTWDSPENNLSQLNKFKVLVHTPGAKVEEIWRQYNLLPKQGAYFIASHYLYNRWGWSCTTKWELVREFDKELRTQGKIDKILQAIDSAIIAQTKLIVLETLFQVLKNEKVSRSEIVRAFHLIKNEAPDLYEEIIDKIAVVYAKNLGKLGIDAIGMARETHVENSQPLSEDSVANLYTSCLSFQKEVIEKMIWLYKAGHPRLDDFFFKSIKSV